MDEYSLQRVSELLRGVIEVLWFRPEGLSARAVFSHFPKTIQLTEHERGLSPSSQLPRYERTIRLAIMPLVKAGWVMKSNKGQWYLTEEGRSACHSFSKPTAFYLEALRISETNQHSASEIQMSLDLAQEKAWEQAIAYIQGKNSAEVRRLVAVLFEAMQYHIAWVAPPEKQRGLIDMVASLDAIGAHPYRILIEVKHTGQPITAEGLKSFHSILGANDFGLLMSTGGFTGNANKLLNTTGFQKINAMNLEKFFDIWIRHFDKLSQEAHQLLPLKAIYFLSPPI
jgi:restriction system protein